MAWRGVVSEAGVSGLSAAPGVAADRPGVAPRRAGVVVVRVDVRSKERSGVCGVTFGLPSDLESGRRGVASSVWRTVARLGARGVPATLRESMWRPGVVLCRARLARSDERDDGSRTGDAAGASLGSRAGASFGALECASCGEPEPGPRTSRSLSIASSARISCFSRLISSLTLRSSADSPIDDRGVSRRGGGRRACASLALRAFSIVAEKRVIARCTSRSRSNKAWMRCPERVVIALCQCAFSHVLVVDQLACSLQVRTHVVCFSRVA